MKKKLIRTAAIPASLNGLLKGQLRFLNDYYEVVGVASHGKGLKRLSKEQGIRTIPVNIERTIHPAKDLFSLFKLYRLFKNEKPLRESVKDFMTEDIITTHQFETLENAKTIMQTHNINSLPVIRNNKLIGIITTNDF